MNAFAFDTLAYVKRLRDAGVDVVQAEAQAEALRFAMQESVATGADILRLENKVTTDIARLESKIAADIARLENEIAASSARLENRVTQVELTLRAEIKDVQSSVIKWIVPLLIGQTAVLAALIRFL